MAFQIDFHLIERDHARMNLPGAPLHRADAGDKFIHVKRLGNILIGARLEGLRPLLADLSYGDDDHRHVGA